MEENNNNNNNDNSVLEKSKQSKKNNNIVLIVILLILFIGVGVGCFFLGQNFVKSSSILSNKEEVISYLEKYFGDNNFEIIEKEKLNEKICNSTGYSWSVKSNKSGVTFDVYETMLLNNSTEKCVRSISDNYEEKARDIFFNNEKLESDNKYHYILYPNDYNSKEELANKIYGLIDKYYLKKKPYAARLIIKVEDTNVAIMPEDINSPTDIVNNYLGGN